MRPIVETTPRAHPSSRIETRSRGFILTLVVVGATIVLFLVSRGKWSDAIIDSGREWIVPDAIARGDLLYRDVVYWFGPLTPYAHAAFFRVFGSSFQTLVLAGAVGSVAVLGSLFVALRSVTGAREGAAWTALAIPALVFMPNAGGSILGMGFRMWHAGALCLLAIALESRAPARRSLWTSPVAGALCGLAGLCRTEWGLAALGAALIACAVRVGLRGRLIRDAGLLILGAAAVFGGAVVFFAAAAGPAAVLKDAPVLLVGIPDVTRRNVLGGAFRAWRPGLAPLLYSSAMWGGAVLLIELAAVGRREPGRIRRRAVWLAATALILVVTAASGGVSGASLFSAAPVVCVGGLLVGLRRAPGPRAAALAGFGLAGLLLSHRRFFFITDAPYVGPALLFAFCSAAGLLHVMLESEGDVHLRERMRVGALAGMTVLVALSFAGRMFHYLADDRVAVPGTARMLSAAPATSTEIGEVAREVRASTREGDGLVVIPEGEVLNFLSGRRNPLRHKLYLPGYLTEHNEGAVLRELQREQPAAIVIWNRPTGEYGASAFGEDYGTRIRRWIADNYVARAYRSPSRPQAVLLIRR